MSMNEKQYNLQQLKQELLKLNLEKGNIPTIDSLFLKNIYCLFGDDNSFVFARQKKYFDFYFKDYLLSPIELINYLIDLIMGDVELYSKYYYLADYFLKKDLSGISEDCFCDNDVYKYNGISYYVTLLSKIVPASYFQNISASNLGIIQDHINVFLAENPEFIYDVIFGCEELDDETDSKKRVYAP